MILGQLKMGARQAKNAALCSTSPIFQSVFPYFEIFAHNYLWDGHCRHGGGSEADGQESQENLRWSNLSEFNHYNMTNYRCDKEASKKEYNVNVTTFYDAKSLLLSW